MLVCDTNLLVHAADERSEHDRLCRGWTEGTNRDPSTSLLTWNVCYGFLRVSAHPRVFRAPWTSAGTRRFIGRVLTSPGVSLPLPTRRHAAVLEQTARELPRYSRQPDA